MFDLSLYSLVLLVHVASAVVLLGSAAFSPLALRAVVRAETLERLRGDLDLLERSIRANLGFAIVLLASGIYLGSAGWWSQGWFYLALASWVANSALAGGVVDPTLRALGRAAADAGDGPVGEAVNRLRRSRRLETAAAVMRGSDFAMLYVMYVKPSAVESLIAIGVAVAVCIGAERLLATREGRWRSGRPTTATVAA